MPSRELSIYGAEVLRQKADPVTEFGTDELRQLVEEMYETCVEEEGAGLAAPQIGVSLRLFVVDCQEFPEDADDPRQRFVMINPEVIATEGTVDSEEGCLSIPGIRATVRGLDVEGEPIEVVADGLVSRCIQHEMDHINGVLFIDRLSSLKRQLLKRQLEEIATS